MSEFPHATAYLCDECYNSMPHYKLKNTVKKQQQVKKGPTYELGDWGMVGALLYILGCSICLAVIAYYLWWK